MRALVAILLFSLSADAQIVQQVIATSAPNAVPCVAPAALVARWTPTLGCSIATTCATDAVAGNNASQTTVGDVPTYTASCTPSGQPCLVGNGTSDFLVLNTPIPSGLTTLTFYAIINVTTSQVNPMFGGASGGLAFRIDATSNTPDLEETAVQGVAGTQTLSLNTWYTVVVTYSNGSTTTNFYNAAGGALIAEGAAASPAFTFSGTTPFLMNDNFGDFFAGKVAEWGYTNSVNAAGIANWSRCRYGVEAVPPSNMFMFPVAKLDIGRAA